jgi:hypothetical protein
MLTAPACRRSPKAGYVNIALAPDSYREGPSPILLESFLALAFNNSTSSFTTGWGSDIYWRALEAGEKCGLTMCGDAGGWFLSSHLNFFHTLYIFHRLKGHPLHILLHTFDVLKSFFPCQVLSPDTLVSYTDFTILVTALANGRHWSRVRHWDTM